MARIRSIKPEFPQSESMGRISRDARLLFILIWTICDDSGITRGNSRMLASLLYPYDEDSRELIEGWIKELEKEECVVRYVVEGTHYLMVKKWKDHQKIDKPTPSKFPSFIESSRITREPSRESREASTTDQGEEGKGREGSRGECEGNTDPEHLPVDNLKPEEPPFDPPAVELAPKTTLLKTEPQKPKPTVNLGHRWTTQQGDDLDRNMADIKARYGAKYHQLTLVWVQKVYSHKNPDAVVQCLARLVCDRLSGKSIPLPGPWLDAVLDGTKDGKAGENGKYDAAISDRECQQYKTGGATLRDLIPAQMRASP